MVAYSSTDLFIYFWLLGMGGVLASMGGVMGRNMMNANFQNAIHAPAFTPL